MMEMLFESSCHGSLYTLGYAASGSEEQLEQLMRDPAMLLIDVRFSPRSRWWPQWNKKALRARWGARYTHEKCLGNVNYRDQTQPIVLCGPHPEQAIAAAAGLLCVGYSLVLLCACRDERRCHRTLIALLIDEERQRREQQR